MSEKEFIDGMSVKVPHEKAPDFVKASGSIKLDAFANYLRELKKREPDAEWLNFQIKVAKSGKWYVERDTWEPKKAADPTPATVEEDDLPW